MVGLIVFWGFLASVWLIRTHFNAYQIRITKPSLNVMPFNFKHIIPYWTHVCLDGQSYSDTYHRLAEMISGVHMSLSGPCLGITRFLLHTVDPPINYGWNYFWSSVYNESAVVQVMVWRWTNNNSAQGHIYVLPPSMYWYIRIFLFIQIRK